MFAGIPIITLILRKNTDAAHKCINMAKMRENTEKAKH